LSKRKDIFDKIVDIVSNNDNIKHTYINVAPTWGNVRVFPASAVLLDTENIELKEYSCSTDRELTVLILIYNKHKNNDYSDILSDILDSIEDDLKNDSDLRDLTTISYPETITQDGGILYPFTMAEIAFKVRYFES